MGLGEDDRLVAVSRQEAYACSQAMFKGLAPLSGCAAGAPPLQRHGGIVRAQGREAVYGVPGLAPPTVAYPPPPPAPEATHGAAYAGTPVAAGAAPYAARAEAQHGASITGVATPSLQELLRSINAQLDRMARLEADVRAMQPQQTQHTKPVLFVIMTLLAVITALLIAILAALVAVLTKA